MRKHNFCDRGAGYVSAGQFKKFLNKNKFIKQLEIASAGEVFLNHDIVEIFKIGYEKNVELNMRTGVNFNWAPDDVIEALVKYKVQNIHVSLDGASQETYSQYRRNGDFDIVIGHIKKLNKIKSEYKSEFPRLKWQYIILPSNDSLDEIRRAKKMAEELGMGIMFKRDWNEYVPKDAAAVSRETGLDFTNIQTADIRTSHSGHVYRNVFCSNLWNSPCVNWDGRLFGCCCNTQKDFGVNVFKKGITAESRLLRKTKRMLMGGPIVPGSPCLGCRYFKNMRENNDFVTEEDIYERWD